MQFRIFTAERDNQRAEITFMRLAVSGLALALLADYLQEMAYWYAGLALNITPQVADYQKNLFLKYAAPAEYGRLQAEFGARSDFLRKHNASPRARSGSRPTSRSPTPSWTG